MFANYEYFVNDQFSPPSERNRSAFAVRAVSARKKLLRTFGHSRSNSARSEFGFIFLKFHSAMDFQYRIIVSTKAMRSETLRDGLCFFIAMPSWRHGNAARFYFGFGVRTSRSPLAQTALMD